MSRGFVKEGDIEEPPVIPPRADLPKNTPNYVTPRGMALLQREKEQLLEERTALRREAEKEKEKRRELAVVNGKLDKLNERIGSARPVDPAQQPGDEVRFGATVRYRMNGTERELTIVGVDEASFKERRVAFTAPIARALNGTRVGETALFERGRETQELEVLSVDYTGESAEDL